MSYCQKLPEVECQVWPKGQIFPEFWPDCKAFSPGEVKFWWGWACIQNSLATSLKRRALPRKFIGKDANVPFAAQNSVMLQEQLLLLMLAFPASLISSLLPDIWRKCVALLLMSVTWEPGRAARGVLCVGSTRLPAQATAFHSSSLPDLNYLVFFCISKWTMKASACWSPR